jgi:SAM-dependent methyltransferase
MSAEEIYAAMRQTEMNDWVGAGDPVEIGAINFASIVENLPLARNHAVLDFGCGIGRTSVLLAEFLSQGGHLVGSDIVPAMIQFCQQQFARSFPNTKFYCVRGSNPLFDLFSMKSSSPSEIIDEKAFFKDFHEAFDVVVAFSVFTHFDPVMASRYLVSLRNVIKARGHLFLTWFLDHPANPPDSRLLSSENFRDRDGNLGFAIFSPTAIADLAISAGLLIERISYGYWRGWPSDNLKGHHYQDIVILRRNGPFSSVRKTPKQEAMPNSREPYHLWARAVSDDEWCEFLAGTSTRGYNPPPMPSEELQRAWTGNAGVDTFREAMAFGRLLKSTLAAAGYSLSANSRLLDIGVGWGRVYRILLRETPHITGIDPVPHCIDLCRSAFPGGTFEISPLAPPYRFSDDEFDVVYLYSVFSHLNESLFFAVLREATRVVRKGGFVVFTTLGPSEDTLRRFGFPESWKADANAGRFLYVPTGGGHESMPASVWGWVHLSEPYLRRIMPDFPLKMLAYEPDKLVQAFVALTKV